MREKLRQYYGQRINITATVSRFGSRKGYKGRTLKTLLLIDVTHNGEIVTDHLWMTSGKWSRHLAEGDTFTFRARVQQYLKGYSWDDEYNPKTIDFRLVRPTVVEITNKNQETLL